MSDIGAGGAAEQPAADLRSQLAQVVADAEAAAEPARAPEKPEASTVPEKPERPSGERLRAPDGKFAAKEGGEEPEEPAIAPVEGVAPEAEEIAPEVTEPAAETPQHWSQADKDLIAGLPKEHQGAVVDRIKKIEAGFTPRLQRAAQIEREYGGVMEMFAPHADMLRQRGQVPADIVKAWGGVEQQLLQGQAAARNGQPNVSGAQIAARIIQNYNIDPGVVAEILMGKQPSGGAQPSGDTAAPVPPALLQKLNELEQRVTQRDRADYDARHASIQQRIDAFAQEKTAKGELKNPFFSELESDMMALARIDQSQGKSPDIADLYERAAYANRETRTKLLAAEQAEFQRKAAAERKAKAEAAKRAASSVTGSPGSGQSSTEQRSGNRSLRATIEAAVADSET